MLASNLRNVGDHGDCMPAYQSGRQVTLDPEVNTLAQLFLSADRAGNRIAGVLFGLGAALFCYLWFKSRYIPRPLAVWGFLSSLVPILAQLATIMVPSLMDVPIRRARSGWPILSFEVIIGLWLSVKGTTGSTTE